MSYEIDFRSPSEKLQEILFKVKLQDIHSNFHFPNTLFPLPVGTPNYMAVVNQSDGQIMSVVGKNYQLISNEDAIEKGKQIFTQLYPFVKPDELIPYKVIAPQSKASAYIDLIHESVDFSVWEQETWLPFLRTTNSYNRSVALSFEIGFVRKLCSNGVIFNKQSIKLKYLHNKGNRVDVVSAANKIKTTSALFTGQCKILKDYAIPQELMFALVCQILNVNLELPKDNQLKKKINSLQNLVELTKILTARYTNELGSNAYAALNVLTDLVSHQDQYKNLTGYYFNVRSYFSKPADWMDEFTKQITNKNFSFEEYLGETIDCLTDIIDKTQFDWIMN